MDSITEIKLINKALNNKKRDIDDSTSFQKSRNIKKISSSLFANSSPSNLAHSLFNNNSSQKFSIHSSFQKNNKSNIIIKFNLNKNADKYTKDDIKKIKEELTKKEAIRPFMKNKYQPTKLKILKKIDKINFKKNLIPHSHEKEKQIKSPRTIFQKILVNLDKLKTRTNKTIEVMKRNLQVTNEEIKLRGEQERQMQLLSSTSYMQKLGYTKAKKNKKTFFNNRQYQTLYITNYKNNNKSTSYILPNISTNNNSNTYNNNYNQSISNGSTSLINLINDTNIINANNNLSSSININTNLKASTKKTFYSLPINNSNDNTKIKSLNKDVFALDSSERKRLKNIPEINLSSINSDQALEPLYPLEIRKCVYKNMYHYRNLKFSLLLIRKQLYKLYDMPALLVEQSAFSEENEMNTLLINNKIRIVQDNIDYFKVNYMYKNDFFDAFKNMENYQKAEFNYNLEEICCVLIKIIPIVLQNYYEIIEKLLSISIPNIAQERLKKPETEFQCLNLNYAFFNSSTEFFNICLEVYKVLHSKENRFIYTLTDFGPLNSYLDIVRYCTNNIISISSAHINKTKGDKKILEKLEVGLNIKKGHRKGIDPLERYHLRHRKPESEIDLKIDRVKRALNMKIEKRDYNIQRPWKKIKIIKDNIIPRKHSTFVSGVFTNMLKYFKPDIRRKIIALQVVDRFESRQYEKNSDDDDNNGGGNSKKCFA